MSQTTKPTTDPAIEAAERCSTYMALHPDTEALFVGFIRQAYAPILKLMEQMKDALLRCEPSNCQAAYPSSPNYNKGEPCGKCGYCLNKAAVAKYRALYPKETGPKS